MIQTQRIKNLSKMVVSENMDAFVVTFIPDLTYLTGIAMEGYWMVVSRNRYWVITNKLLDGSFLEMGVPSESLLVRMNFKELLEELAQKNKWSKIGFDGEGATYALGKYFEEKGYVNCPKFPASLRVTKDKEEISAIRRACQITAKTMDYIGKKIKPGMKESDVALEIEYHMRKQGAQKNSFDLIVGSGPNSAVPHHRTGERKIKADDAVVIDIGCVFQNYCSDMTRTFFVGKKPTDLYRKVHGIVAESQKAGVQKIQLGLAGRDVDQACRSIIEREGMGELFTHGTGHGVGLEIHEPPWIRAKSENLLGPGMIITVEPGIYLDGKLGVRIEDTVLVTQNGAEVLTKP